MRLNKHRKLLWVIAIWFACLQAMAPFIHGHMEIDQSGHGHGMHFHDDESDHAFSGQSMHAMHDVSHVAHTVVIASGIKKDQDSSVFPMVALLIFFLALIPQPRISVPLARLTPFIKPLFKRRPSSPRAPPLY
jgi:hypothetical protein